MSALRTWLRRERTRNVDRELRRRQARLAEDRAAGSCPHCGARRPHICFGEPDPIQERVCAGVASHVTAVTLPPSWERLSAWEAR